jgi:hypothetical protein
MAAEAPKDAAGGAAPKALPVPRNQAPKKTAQKRGKFVPDVPLPVWLQHVQEAVPELRDRFVLATVLAASLRRYSAGPLPDARSVQEAIRWRLRRLCDGCAPSLGSAPARAD